MSATNPATLPSVTASVQPTLSVVPVARGGLPPSTAASAGSNTSTSTTTRSSTTSQPIAIRPLTECNTPRASSARSSTTVLATDSEMPKTIPAPMLQPHASAVTAPSAVATPICTTAPGMAMRRTASRSSSEKCSPTPNIISITPISASWPVSSTSATNPGVAGPITMPATR
jgi:hypothetical protein